MQKDMEDYIQLLVEPYLPEELTKNRTKKQLGDYVWEMALEESNKGLPIMQKMEAKWYPELHAKKMAYEERRKNGPGGPGAPPPQTPNAASGPGAGEL